MEFILRGHAYETFLLYMDDAIFVSWVLQGQYDHLQKVFRVAGQPTSNETLKSANCSKKRRGLTYCITGRVTIDQEKLKVVWEWPPPRDKHDGSLLGLFICYQKFIVAFAELAKPLIYITEGMLVFQWSSQADFWFLKTYVWYPS
jgi:hypothetical protein